MITIETLRRFAPRINNPEIHASALEQARISSSVTTPRRLCHFLGQVFVETGAFAHMVENLNYRDPERLDALFSAVRGIEDARALIRLLTLAAFLKLLFDGNLTLLPALIIVTALGFKAQAQLNAR